jgi:Putative Flp pilus-assembly TadE/G-like
MASVRHSGVRSTLERFNDCERGVTAIMFALIAVPVLGLSLAAFDYARAQGSKAAIQDAADAASRAGANMLGAPHSDIEDAIRGYLKTNLPKDREDLPFALTFAPEDQALTIKLATTVRTSILGIVGVPEFAVAVESTAVRPQPLPIAAPPSGGVTPELPADVASRIPGLDRHISPSELREAEAVAQRILSELERHGGGAEVEKLLRGLKELR